MGGGDWKGGIGKGGGIGRGGRIGKAFDEGNTQGSLLGIKYAD